MHLSGWQCGAATLTCTHNMKTLSPERVKELKAEIRATRAEMRERGIKRVSCFNGGLDSETYRLNARMFALQTELGR